MSIKQKKLLMAKCRACGHEQQLDTNHKAGAQLLKQLPKYHHDIEKTFSKKPEEEDKGGDDNSANEEPAEVQEQIGLDSEEIGKCFNYQVRHI